MYKEPYDALFPVVCMDKSPKQSIEDAKSSIDINPGQKARVNYEYIRHGIVNIF